MTMMKKWNHWERIYNSKRQLSGLIHLKAASRVYFGTISKNQKPAIGLVYSYFKESTGLVSAALVACEIIVTRAISKVNNDG